MFIEPPPELPPPAFQYPVPPLLPFDSIIELFIILLAYIISNPPVPLLPFEPTFPSVPPGFPAPLPAFPK